MFSGHSSTSLDTCSDTSSYIDKLAGHDARPSRLISHIPIPTLSTPHPRQSSAFEKVSRCLRSVMTALKGMGCSHGACRGRSSITSTRRISKPFPLPSSDEKIFQAPAGSVHPDQLTLTNASISIRTAQEVFSDVLCSTDCAHTPAHSSNMPYKECHLFDDESLRFATAFLPTMESLVVWSMAGSTETLDSGVQRTAPSTSWIRRNTCVRPGHIIQIPSMHDKDNSYLLACESNETARPRVENALEMVGAGPCPKFFVAQQSGIESRNGVDGYSRAFIMCDPLLEG